MLPPMGVSQTGTTYGIPVQKEFNAFSPLICVIKNHKKWLFQKDRFFSFSFISLSLSLLVFS
jgi:hypothetical protein